jgi:1-acyl-sn-glycerol-3-phosphate acyltransferase
MRTFLLFLTYVVIVLLAIPVLFVCWVGKWRGPIVAIGKGAVWIGQKVLGIRVEVSGIERVEKDKTYVFMANHMSFLDGPMLYRLIPQPAIVILKKGILRLPVIGLAMKQVGFIPVSKKGEKGRGGSVEKATQIIREKGFSFLIFPEGTRSPDGKLASFRRGGFFLAMNSQVPIIPITLTGTYELMPKKSIFVKKGRVKVIFHPPFSTQGFDETSLPELIERIRNIIASGKSEK